jgi:hypothetical protein
VGKEPQSKRECIIPPPVTTIAILFSAKDPLPFSSPVTPHLTHKNSPNTLSCAANKVRRRKRSKSKAKQELSTLKNTKDHHHPPASFSLVPKTLSDPFAFNPNLEILKLWHAKRHAKWSWIVHIMYVE